MKLDTVHVTNGKEFKVVNKVDLDAGLHEGYEPVGKKSKASEKTEAEAIASMNVGDLKKAIVDLDAEALAEVLEAEKNGKGRESAIAAIESAQKPE